MDERRVTATCHHRVSPGLLGHVAPRGAVAVLELLAGPAENLLAGSVLWQDERPGHAAPPNQAECYGG